MAKTFALSLLLLATCAGAVRIEGEDLALNAAADPHDDKCAAAVPGTAASRKGSILGGLKECACTDDSFVIADAEGTGSWYTINGHSEFEFEKAGLLAGSKCMSKNEKAIRAAKKYIKQAFGWTKDSSSSWKFLGVKFQAQALGSSGSALSGGEGVIFSTDNYLGGGFDCASRTPKVAELDAACADGAAAFVGHFQSEATACLDAVRGLDLAKSFVDGGAFGQAVAALSETAKTLKETNSRDSAAGAAKRTWAAMLTLTKEIDSKIGVPPM